MARCSSTAISHLSCLTYTMFNSYHRMKRSLQGKRKAASKREATVRTTAQYFGGYIPFLGGASLNSLLMCTWAQGEVRHMLSLMHCSRQPCDR